MIDNDNDDAFLRPKIIEDLVYDDFGIIRSPGAPRIEIAIAHDGSANGVLEAECAATAIMALPMVREVLREATGAWSDAFTNDGYISGADLLDWFARWRLRAQAALETLVSASPTSGSTDHAVWPCL